MGALAYFSGPAHAARGLTAWGPLCGDEESKRVLPDRFYWRGQNRMALKAPFGRM